LGDEDAHSNMTRVDGKGDYRAVRDVCACHIDISAVSPMISFLAAFSCLS